MRVYYRPQTHRGRLAAGRTNLLIRHGLRAAVADGSGRKELDHIRAIRLCLPHERADLLGGARAIVNRTQGRDDPWTWYLSRIDQIANSAIHFSADTLDRGKTAHQGCIRARGRIQCAEFGSLLA